MSKISKKLLTSLVVLIALVYIAGAVYFTNKTFPKTTVNGVERGQVSKDEMFDVKKGVQTIKLEGRDDKSLEVVSTDINFSKEIKGTPQHGQNQWMWPIEIFKEHNYDIEFNTRYDEGKLKNLVENSTFMAHAKEPVNASVVYSEKNKLYEISPEELGTKIDSKAIEQVIIEGFENEKDVNLEDKYSNPEITKDTQSLKDELAKANEIVSKKYIFDFEDRQYELTGKPLYEMYSHADGKYALNQDKLHDYIADIAVETDTYGTSRKFKATGIGEITVPPGIYGWQMNVQKTKENMLAMVNEGKDGEVEINYNISGTIRATDDIGNTYIEVDLSRQTAWYYKDGVLNYETPMVSGTASVRNAATPVGVNVVWTKEKDIILKGRNEVSGTPYAVPIKYWMNVGWTGSGFHDTDYRTAYGGNIYLNDGSSSCMNIPPDRMEVLFSKVSVGTPVVIYESSTSYSPTEFEKQAINREREQEEKEKEEQKDNRG